MDKMRSAPMKVVLLDDNADVVDMLALVLKDKFPEAIFRVFSDSRKALSAVLLDRPDVIVSDLEMPVMSGQELAKAARDSGERPPLLVAVSGNGLEIESAPIKRLFDHSFVKPIDLDRLVRVLQDQ